MDENRINFLAEKLFNGELDQAEKEELEQWYQHLDSLEYPVYSTLTEKEFADRLYGRIAGDAGLTVRKSRRLFQYTAAAASLLIAVSIAGYLFWSPFKKTSPANSTTAYASTIVPGSNKAVLTLSTGEKIDLTAATKGRQWTDGQSVAEKEADGQLSYREAAAQGAGKTAYNTLTTPRGGNYTIRLSDGSLAVLDAGSSISYPLMFNAAHRTVTVTGQVYFEVVHRDKQPFYVKAGGHTVKDLGTQFNVYAYPDEPLVKVTLEEGSVSVAGLQQTVLLKPGQVGIGNGNGIVVKEADLEETLAWKNGYFRFNDEPIQSIMSKISRWYDVDIQYEAAVSSVGFNGVISRSKNIEQVLKMLERTGAVHFKITERRITVLP